MKIFGKEYTFNGFEVLHKGNFNPVTGNVATATKLQTARTINGVSFDGSANITITANPNAHNHSISDITNLQTTLDGKASTSHGNHVPTTETANNTRFLRNDNTWQVVDPNNINAEYKQPTNTVRNNLGNPTVTEKALFHGQFNNKFRFITPILQEESSDDITWTTSSRASLSVLKNMMRGEGEGTSFSAIPITAVGGKGYYRLTWDATQTGYVFLDHLYVYCSTSGNTVGFKIERYHNTSGWSTLVDSSTNNWPGHVSLPHTSIPFSTSASQYGKVRVTFSITNAANTNGFTLYGMEWFGGYPAGRRNVESYDGDKNVTFPASINGTQLISSVSTGTPPLQVSSTTKVTNLNADMLNDMSPTSSNTVSSIVSRDSSGNFSAGTITATLNGNASTATKLATARTINGVSFDGSANITITANPNAHTHTKANITDFTHTHTKSEITDFAHTHSEYALASHGNHVPTTQTANNAVFLRNDNSWQTVTPANIGAMATTHTANTITALGGTSQALGTASNGSGTAVALANHVHPTTGLMTTSHAANAITGFGASGTATTVARSDHGHAEYLTSAPVTSVSGKTGAVSLTSSDVGLGNVDNIQQATKTEFNTHNGDNTRHITAAERTAWTSNRTPYQSVSGSTGATAGWYRIATSAASIANCNGRFDIVSAASGYHTACTVEASISYGVSPDLTILNCSHYSGKAISKIRIVYHTTYSGNYAYLEIYTNASVAMSTTVGYVNGTGWTLLTPSTVGSIPSGYTSVEMDMNPGLTSNNPVYGNVTGNVTGNASTATKLATARTINGVSFDGTSNITITAAPNAHSHAISDITNLQTTLDGKFNSSGGTFSGAIAAPGVGSSTSIGVTNLSATSGLGVSLYGTLPSSGAPSYGLMFSGTATYGKHGAVTGDWATYFTMSGATTRGWVFKSGNGAGGNVASISAAGVFSGDGSGLSNVSALKLATPRKIILSGSISGSADFDGTSDIIITTTGGGGGDGGFSIKEEEFIATANQTDFTLKDGAYLVGSGSLQVYIDGQPMANKVITEKTATTFSLPTGIQAGAVVRARYIVSVSGTPVQTTHGSSHAPGGSDAIPGLKNYWVQETQPTATSAGDKWFQVSTSIERVWNGSVWIGLNTYN